MEKFTNIYPLSKTLRFELKPEEKTKEIFEEWLGQIDNKNGEIEDNYFLKDKKIAAAYVALKPILDKIHENFIDISLSSITNSPIDFSPYFESYQNKSEIDEIESNLRIMIGKSFSEGERFYLEQFKKINIQVKSNAKNPYKCLTDKGILEYIFHNAALFESKELPMDAIKQHLNVFKSFFTYLSGFNQNRENYYIYDKEKATAIATRIVHENLPKFCDNIIRFENRRDEYLSIYEWLKYSEKITQIKNAKSDTFEDVAPICEDYFVVSYFNHCLTQQQIDEYNRTIGNFNLLINLYNQAKKQEDKSFRKIDEFTTLFKQIGSDKRKCFVPKLLADCEDSLPTEIISKGGIFFVKSLINALESAGREYFNNTDDSKDTVISFINFLKSCENWEGIYWSKRAINSISKSYLSNWHSLIDRLKDKKACATYDNKREEPIQLRDAIELSELFEALNEEKSEYVFKDKLISKGLVDTGKTPSENLINLICNEIEENISKFIEKSDAIVKLDKYRQDSNDNHIVENDPIIQQIKEWFDCALDIIKTVRFFSVRSSKMKGHPANTDMERMLNHILRNDDVDWFGWYDLIRNYLTQKPQEKTKENKLKLNFGTSSLLGGWSDGQERVKAATLLRHGKYIYLCLLKKKNIFDTSKENNPIYINSEESTASRLILRNLKFQTLAGKGFLGEFGMSYGDMSVDDPQKAIISLQKIMRDRYIHKYPLLKSLAEDKYTDKKLFDSKISEALKECYVCEFTPINWSLVKQEEFNGNLFLFRISSKDFKERATGKKDLQTIYWEDLLTGNSTHQLAANAEVFMREPLESKAYTHSIGEKMVNRKDTNGSSIPNSIFKELFKFYNNKIDYNDVSPDCNKYIDNSLAIVKDVKHEIKKDRRFYERKYLFHCPIKLNYKANTRNINECLRKSINEINNINFIGVDRGEKHLVYTCQIDNDCNIIECKHYDTINGTNYVHKLEDIAKLRTNQRQNWQGQNSIKSLKEGYISHVVHALTENIIKDQYGNINPHAYIVLEDLNSEMKRGRQKFEKQVYQNLETALAKKLNFVVDKSVKLGELGSVSHALQLTPELKTYDDIKGKKQFGVMLYTRANYTSVTDPATGWRQTIYLKNGSEEEIKKQVLEIFDNFGFDGKDYFFEYTEKNVGKIWRLYSGVDGVGLPRFRNKEILKEDHNIWVPEAIDIIPILDRIFENFDKKESFKTQVENGVKLRKIDGRKETAWQTLRFVIGLIQQIRNSGIVEADDNFLYSPVRNEEGVHFDTRKAARNEKLAKIVDADANGAYNIARKGLIMDAHIKYATQNNISFSDVDLFISDEEWDMWLLDREKWKARLGYFSERNKNREKSSNTKRPKKK